jgi:hypothetical protein
MDTIGGTLNQEVIIGYNNASHLYLGSPKSSFLVIGGDAGEVKIANDGLVAAGKVKIATGSNAAGSEIKIGSTFSNTIMNGNTFIYSGSQYPLRVISISNYGARFEPQAGQNAKGNIQIHGCFPSIPGDTGPRRVCDIYGGFTGNSWGAEYMALGVGYNSVTNDASNPTIEKIRIQSDTTIFYTPLTPNYSYTFESGAGVGKIGEWKKIYMYSKFIFGGIPTTMQYIDLTPGVWLLTAYAATESVGAPYNAMSFSFADNALDSQFGMINIAANSGYTYNLATSYTIPTTINYRIYQVMQSAQNQTFFQVQMCAARIA